MSKKDVFEHRFGLLLQIRQPCTRYTYQAYVQFNCKVCLFKNIYFDAIFVNCLFFLLLLLLLLLLLV